MGFLWPISSLCLIRVRKHRSVEPSLLRSFLQSLGVVGGGDVQQGTGDQIQGDLFSSGDAESLKGTHNPSSP